MFYVRDENARYAWIPVAESASKWDKMVALNKPVVVHGKMGGRFKKDVEGVAYAMDKDHLLVAVDYDKYAHLDSYDRGLHDRFDVTKDGKLWLQLYSFDGCAEGYRFKRNIVKLFKWLHFVAKEVQKVRRSETVKAEIEAERGHREGLCAVCFGDYIVDADEKDHQQNHMVLHGYKRPGTGYTYGRCPGMAFPNFEISCAGTKAYLKMLHSELERQRERLAEIPSLDKIDVAGWDNKVRTYKRSEPDFKRQIDLYQGRVESNIRATETEIAIYTRYVNEWKPAKWPRKAPPPEGTKKRGPILHQPALFKNREGMGKVGLCKQYALSRPNPMRFAEKPEDVTCKLCRSAMETR